MVSERTKDLIHKYLEGLLSEEEQQELREHLKDPECREYFTDASQADAIITKGMMKKVIEEDPDWDTSELSDEEIREDIRKYRSNKDDNDETLKFVKELDRAYHRKQKRKKRIRKIIPLLAAAAMVAVVLILWSTFGGLTGEKLYARYYEKYQFELSRSDIKGENSYIRAVENYNEGNYEASMNIGRQILDNNPDHPEARFVYALSLQETGLIDEAIEQYRPLVEKASGRNERIKALSAWYLGLCYVLEEEPVKALEYLNIAKENAGMFLDENEVDELMRKVGEI